MEALSHSIQVKMLVYSDKCIINFYNIKTFYKKDVKIFSSNTLYKPSF